MATAGLLSDLRTQSSQISGETKLFAMLGDPIAQVVTPEAINPIFASIGANVVCVPWHVDQGSLPAVWASMKLLKNLVGCAITLPHKGAAAQLCDELSTAARVAGVVNGVRRERDGRMVGDIFDGVGFVGGLRAAGIALEGHRVLLLGAGGAATAIAFALVTSGIGSISVANRTRDKAERLVSHLNLAAGRDIARVGLEQSQPFSLVVNGTSLGMHSNDDLPLDPGLLRPGMVVAEVVAKPARTRFLEEAAKRGCRTHEGIHMIANQVSLIAQFIATGG